MTEMSPLGTLGSLKPEYAGLTGDARLDVQMKQGHPPFGVEMKITDDDDRELPRDGKTFGRLKVRGPSVARAYFKEDAGVLDDEGFFDTGDVGTIDRYGYLSITDRSKDVIKSGGEWISSIELENLAVGHPKVAEAAVIGVRHPKWDERPLARDRAQGGPVREQGGTARFPRRQDRQMVAAGRRRIRQRDPAHGNRQDPEDRSARTLQELRAAERRRVIRPTLEANQTRLALPGSDALRCGVPRAGCAARTFALSAASAGAPPAENNPYFAVVYRIVPQPFSRRIDFTFRA